MTSSASSEWNVLHIDPSSAPLDLLYQLIRAQGHLTVVLDPLALSPTWDFLAQLERHEVPHQYLKDPLFEDRPQDAPLLTQIGLSNWPILESMVEQAKFEATRPGVTPRSVCGFVESSLSLQSLAVILQKALDLRVEQQSIYFRYFDPRTFFHLPRLIAPPALATMLRGISSWSHFLWNGQLHRHVLPTQSLPSLTQRRLKLTTEQWRPFTAIEHFNACQGLFSMLDLPYSPESVELRFEQVRQAIEQGLTKPEDTAYFLACCEVTGTNLAQHAKWDQVLSAIQAEVPFADAIEQLCAISLANASPRH